MSEMTRPGAKLVAITPSDTADIEQWNGACPRGLYVGGAGNVAVVTPDGSAVTLTAVAAGQVYPIQVRRVNSTNTTATDLVGIY